MKRRAVVVLFIAIVVVGVILLLSGHGTAPGTGGLAKVIVDAGRLPAKARVLGAEVQLDRVDRTSQDEVRIGFSARDKRGSHASPVLRVGDTFFAWTAGSSEAMPSEHRENGFTLSDSTRWSSGVPITRGCPGLTIEQLVYLDRPEKKLKFKFQDVSPADLPVTRKIGDVEATLERVYVNEAIDPRGAHPGTSYGIIPGTRAFALEVRLRSPTGYMQRSEDFMYGPGTGRRRLALTDDNGRTHRVTGTIVCQEDHDYRPLPPSAFERLVALVDQNRAVAMARRRHEAAMREMASRQTRIYAYPVIDPPPTRFSVEIPLAIPPDPGDAAMVTFENVSVPKTVLPQGKRGWAPWEDTEEDSFQSPSHPKVDSAPVSR